MSDTSTALNGFVVPLCGLREPVSGLTHFLGALLGIGGTLLLWRRSAADRVKQVSMAVYGATLVALYSASAIYHSVDLPPALLVPFRRMDHAAIFLLIAGTFTPFYMTAVRGWWRLGNLLMIWGLAFVGIGMKLLDYGMGDALSASMYVCMGWLALIGYGKLASMLSHRAMALTMAGGVIYSMAAAIDVARAPVLVPGLFGFHELLHVVVMVASAVHFYVVLRFIVPLDRLAAEPRSDAPALAAVAAEEAADEIDGGVAGA